MVFILTSCQSEPNLPKFKVMDTLSKNGGEPNLFVSERDEVFLSWVEYLNDTTDALVYSKLEGEQWSDTVEIARGSNWFVNWADFPSLVGYKDGGLRFAAHYLQKSAEGTYDYDIHVIQSQDQGMIFSKPFILHRDSIAAEHGFVTLLPIANDRIFATWLDGRNTKVSESAKEENKHGHGSGGAMTLRGAEFDIGGHYFEEAELDNRICDCCQTDAALTSDGVIVVYRDRSEHEIRDISIVRRVNKEWTKPHTVHADNWEISGCPVNGPSVDAIDSTVAVVWYTAANGKPTIKISFSEDSGATFNSPIKVDNGNPLGRVDVVLISKEKAVITWVENTESMAEIRAVGVQINGTMGEDYLLTETSPARNSGFPKLKKTDTNLYLAWTEVDSVLTRVKTLKWGF